MGVRVDGRRERVRVLNGSSGFLVCLVSGVAPWGVHAVWYVSGFGFGGSVDIRVKGGLSAGFVVFRQDARLKGVSVWCGIW